MASSPLDVRSAPPGAAASTLTASVVKSVDRHSSFFPAWQSATYFFPTSCAVMVCHLSFRGRYTTPALSTVPLGPTTRTRVCSTAHGAPRRRPVLFIALAWYRSPLVTGPQFHGSTL